jgi:hypothetical protein
MARGWTLFLGGLAAALCVPVAAAADPLEVRWVLADKVWKKVRAETTLTVSMYHDDACSALFDTFDVLAGDVTTVAQIKTSRPKGGAKAPTLAELRISHTLSDPPPNLFVSIAGVGIEPLPGRECQAQLGSANAAWHWWTGADQSLYKSPSLEGVVASRLTGEPVGRYCLDFPDFPNPPRLALAGLVVSLQSGFPGYVVRANVINNNLCNVNGQGEVLVSVDRFDGDDFVPAEGAYTIMVPGGATIQTPP